MKRALLAGVMCMVLTGCGEDESGSTEPDPTPDMQPDLEPGPQPTPNNQALPEFGEVCTLDLPCDNSQFCMEPFGCPENDIVVCRLMPGTDEPMCTAPCGRFCGEEPHRCWYASPRVQNSEQACVFEGNPTFGLGDPCETTEDCIEGFVCEVNVGSTEAACEKPCSEDSDCFDRVERGGPVCAPYDTGTFCVR